MSIRNGRAGKSKVKAILFYTDPKSFASKIGLYSKLFGIFLISIGILHAINQPRPDLVFVAIMFTIALFLLVIAGSLKYVFKTYLVIIQISFVLLFLWWLIFNQVGATPLLSLHLFGIKFDVTALSLETGTTKALAYSAMSMLTFFFLTTVKDNEITASFEKLGLSFKKALFPSMVIREIHLLQMDVSNLVDAQFVRGYGIKSDRNYMEKVSDFFALSSPIISIMIKRAVDSGIALEARGYRNANPNVAYHEQNKFYIGSAFFVILSVILLIIPYLVNLTVISGLL